jgi:hypothetical protein
VTNNGSILPIKEPYSIIQPEPGSKYSVAVVSIVTARKDENLLQGCYQQAESTGNIALAPLQAELLQWDRIQILIHKGAQDKNDTRIHLESHGTQVNRSQNMTESIA